jgi:RNA polymerase subunit RPABC4/transcription elongation factor Spt4
MSKLPISKACPNCGNSEFSRQKSKRFVAFAPDRICAQCETRYTPPTPVWAGLLFIFAAIALPVLGFVLITVVLGHPFSVLGLVCEGVFVFFAIVAFFGGIRSLIESSEQTSSASNTQRPDNPPNFKGEPSRTQICNAVT